MFTYLDVVLFLSSMNKDVMWGLGAAVIFFRFLYAAWAEYPSTYAESNTLHNILKTHHIYYYMEVRNTFIKDVLTLSECKEHTEKEKLLMTKIRASPMFPQLVSNIFFMDVFNTGKEKDELIRTLLMET